ncbi:MAG TPA: alpha/beta hydrolase [Streptosporangiaceae bacterium]|jgi:acetyl esterase
MAADQPEDLVAAGLADLELARWVRGLRQAGSQPAAEAGPAALRRASQARAGQRPRGPDLPVVTDLTVAAGLATRLYRPARQPRPLTLFLHGGAFMLGDLESHDNLCRWLARVADLAVLAVGYRRAPEYPAPAAVDDAMAVFAWAAGRPAELGADPAAGIGLAGDSAGATIALLAAAALRDHGTPASALLLACPNADMTLSQPSVQELGRGWGLDADDMRWFIAQWIPDPAQRSSPRFSPLRADLAGLPPAVIGTAGHDPLRDEGAALAGRLRAAGASVQHRHYPGLVHGFVMLGEVSPAAARAREDLLGVFGRVMHGQPPAG